MQILLHTDFLLEATLAETPRPVCAELLDRCRQNKVKGWVLASSISAITRETRRNRHAHTALNDWLAAVSILPVTGHELRDALSASQTGWDEALAAQAVRAFHLHGVVTFNPDASGLTGVQTLQPEEILKLSSPGSETVSAVPLVDLPASYHDFWDDMEQAVMDAIRSGKFILGPQVAELEERIAAYCQSSHAVGVSSGTDALLVALMAAGVGPGDEVISTPYTFFATLGSIARVGARPVLVDIEHSTFNINPDLIEEKINEKTRAILPVHLFGQCADMDPILELARKHGLTVIEDAAQAIGSEYKFRRAGSLGDFGCFSFFPTKNLGGFGDGGIVATSSEEACKRMKMLRTHGAASKYRHKVIGGNFRLDTLQAAAVGAKLPRLEEWTEKRRQTARNYRRLFEQAGLSQAIQLPAEMFPRHIYNQYVIRAPGKRDDLKNFLKEKKIGTEVYYPVPMHLQESFASLGYRKSDFPESERAALETLALPISHEVTAAQQERVIGAIKDFFSR
ncbi:MAG: aminotransferase class I/II-fold pyridoxal phosphate-dependent enzyme [Nitrospinales bacterium]